MPEQMCQELIDTSLSILLLLICYKSCYVVPEQNVLFRLNSKPIRIQNDKMKVRKLN